MKRPVTGQAVVRTLQTCVERHGIPYSTLTDNGMVYTARFAQGGRTSRNGFEKQLVRLGIRQKNSRPNHPTTCGKVERFQQTLKKWLRARPPAHTITQLQQQLDMFVEHYNHQRPHRSLPHRATPATIYNARPKAGPAGRNDPDHRVRYDRISQGNVSLRINGELHHIGIGRTFDRTPVILLIHDLDVRIIHAANGEILRHLTIDPNRRYHGTGQPRTPPKNKKPEP